MPRQTGKPGLASNFARQTIRFEKLHPIEESIYIFEDKFNAKHCERLSQVLVQGGGLSVQVSIYHLSRLHCLNESIHLCGSQMQSLLSKKTENPHKLFHRAVLSLIVTRKKTFNVSCSKEIHFDCTLLHSAFYP